MAEEGQTGGQGQETSQQQTNSQAGENWEQRYRGASLVINRLTEEKKQLDAQLLAKASELEQLRSELGVKVVEKDTAVNTYRSQLETTLRDKDIMARELSELKAMKAKLDIAKKLGRNDLVGVIDSIPYVEDATQLEGLMKTFLDWGDTLVKEREKQLLAGVTTPAPAQSAGKPTPQNTKEWGEHVNSLPLGSPERKKAMDDWFRWGMTQAT